MTKALLPKRTLQLDADVLLRPNLLVYHGKQESETEVKHKSVKRSEVLKEITGVWVDRFSAEKSSDEIVKEWRSQWSRC